MENTAQYGPSSISNDTAKELTQNYEIKQHFYLIFRQYFNAVLDKFQIMNR